MSHHPNHSTDQHDSARVADAMRLLVHLLARQVVREAMDGGAVQDGGTDGRQEQD